MARKRRGRRVARLGMPGDGAQLAESKTERRPNGNGLGQLVQARRQADGVGKFQAEDFNGEFRRGIQGGGQAGQKAVAGGAAEGLEGAVVNLLRVLREKDRADEAAVEPTHGRAGSAGCGRDRFKGSSCCQGLPAAPDAGLAEEIAIGGQGQEGPTVAIHVVLQVEDARETGAGRFRFGPGAVGVLGANEVGHAGLDAGAVGVAEGAEAHDGPGGLGGGAGALAFEDGVVVGVAAFAPAAVLVLDAFQPVAGFEEPGLAQVQAEGAEAAQDLPGAVDIIDAPAAVPGAVGFLVFADEFQGLAHLRVLAGRSSRSRAIRGCAR